MNFWFTTFSAVVLTSYSYLSLVSSEAVQADPTRVTWPLRTYKPIGPGTCKEPEHSERPYTWDSRYCGEDNLLHGCVKWSDFHYSLGGRCWKQCEVGGSTWCWTAHWKYDFLLTFNTCSVLNEKGKLRYQYEAGKDCYNHKDRFCRSICFPESMGKNE